MSTTFLTYLTGTVQTKAYRLLREHVYAVLGSYELTPTHWSVLGSIAVAKDGIRQVDVAHDLRVKAPLITGIVQQLTARELIRSVPNQFDGRAKLLALTPKGKRVLKIVETKLQAHLQDLLSGLTEVDLTTYYKVLTTIIANSELPHS